MDTLDRATLVELARPSGWPSVSIYVPSNRMPRQAGEGRLRFKNLVREAAERLTTEGMRDTDAENFLRPLYAIRDDDTWWRDTADGLAVFLSKDTQRTLRLGISMPEQVVVGDRFYLRPLAAAHLKTDNRFYVLALDKGGRRLFAGDRGSIEELDLGDVPTSIEDSARLDEATELRHTAPYAASRKHQGKGSPEGGAFPGHGQELEYETDQLTGFIRQVEGGVDRAIGRNTDLPFVLIGPARVVAEYRRISRCPVVAVTNIKLNTDAYSSQMVHETALELLEPYFEQQTVRKLTRVTDEEGTELVTRDAETIAHAAAVGRVKSLFFDDGVGPFGTFDRERMEAKAVCDSQPRLLRERGDTAEKTDGTCGWDLIDLALAETVLHDGEIHVFQGEDAPIHGAVALLRY